MGKNMTKKKKLAKRKQRQKYLRTGVLSALVVVGVGVMVGMAMFNANAKPQRDMKWYIRDEGVQVAAPPVGEGYAADGSATSAQRGSEEDGPVLAVITPRPTVKPTMEPRPEATAIPRPAATEAPADDAQVYDGGDASTDADEDVSTLFDDDIDLSDGGDATYDATADDTQADASGTVMIKISAAGDCTFGGEVGSKGRRRFIDYVNRYGLDYFFEGVRPVFENDDLTIVNLEGPLTTVENSNKHGFVFKGDPEYVRILTDSSVELCNVANNHTLDYGKAGLKETAQVLDAAGVGYCGYSRVYSTVIKGVRVKSLGFTWWDYDKEQIAKAVAEARQDCDLLIVNIHWGVEGSHNQDSKQEAMAHAIIDAGADLLIGTHPHVYQGIEKYKGKYIVYSLGNFCFAGNANPADKRCLIFQQTFSFNPGMGIAQANIMDAGINIIPCTVSSVKDKNDFQPTIMAAKEGAALLKAVASQSTNFSLTNSLWMRDNYLVTTGLVKPEEDQQEGAPATADLSGDAAEGEEGADATDTGADVT